MKRVTGLLALVTLVMGIGSTACTTADGMRQREQSIAAKDARLERDCVDRVMLFSRAANELAVREGRGRRIIMCLTCGNV